MNWLKTEVKATMTKKKTSKQPEQVVKKIISKY